MSGFTFSAFPIMFTIVFVVIIGIFIFVAVRGITTWAKNNNSPKIPAEARIVSKRSQISGGMGDAAASTSYYVTFEFSTGDRKELHIPYNEYGLLAEGDSGILTFQGTRYISFQRK